MKCTVSILEIPKACSEEFRKAAYLFGGNSGELVYQMSLFPQDTSRTNDDNRISFSLIKKKKKRKESKNSFFTSFSQDKSRLLDHNSN